MKTIALRTQSLLAIGLAAMLSALPVLAAKPTSGEHGKSHKEETKKHKDDHTSADQRDHFEDRHRVAVHEYYVVHYSGARCPPGLAKKHNGCMPPGQAKKWQRGRPLPHDVIFYEVPQALVVQIGLPPPNHRYVRVATDILLIIIGTGIVIDAIEDLGR